jgi:hypothetical protein
MKNIIFLGMIPGFGLSPIFRRSILPQAESRENAVRTSNPRTSFLFNSEKISNFPFIWPLSLYKFGQK